MTALSAVRPILHIPHASTTIPDEYRHQFVVSDEELALEIARLTDHFTDELFTQAVPGAEAVVHPVSRFLLDPERFEKDQDEPMAQRGHGAIYRCGTRGQPLRRDLTAQERVDLIETWYRPHHARLEALVRESLDSDGRAAVIDCHSFPNDPLPMDLDQTHPRPDFCLGTDPFHTPQRMVERARSSLEGHGYSVWVDRPYSGALVPAAFHQKDDRVLGMMIEVNRTLYMSRHGAEVQKAEGFDRIAAHLGEAIRAALRPGGNVTISELSDAVRAQLTGTWIVGLRKAPSSTESREAPTGNEGGGS